jgi:hypothetical protein
LCHCRACGFAYYNPRLESDEMRRLYDGYRDIKYQKMRQRHEPRYTEKFNSALGSDPQELRTRKDLLRDFLKLEKNLDKIKSVLDYGGDRGQFIIDELSDAERYVYEISGVTPDPGIISMQNIDDCKTRKYNLIMCSHVLEHLPDPLNEFRQVVELADEDTLIYIELPYETPFGDISLGLKREIIGKMYDLISTSPSLVDFIFRRLLNNYKMNEHINFFNGQSLRKMMDLLGLEILRLDVPSTKIGPFQISILRCLLRKKPST